jgi:serine-type D-Ala-D-Ala carboxypeptidase (penicillin-binding protein 5/6)
MKKWVILVLVLAMVSSVAYARPTSPKKTRPGRNGPQTKGQVQAEKEDPYKAYIVVEGSTGRVLEGENIHMKWPPASIAKLMLTAVVLEKIEKGGVQLSDRVPVSKEASKMGGSQVFLKEGENFTLEEYMKAILVASANDAAYAVAEFIAGSAGACVSLMNEKAKALNMVDSEFRSVHGLPPSEGAEEDLTSCSDLALLARALLQYPKLIEWTSIKMDSFRNGTFIMNNHNKLLNRMSAVDGLKTGFYRKAGYNVVVTAKKGDLRLIAVVMGSPAARTRDSVAEEKLKKYFTQYSVVSVVNKGDVIDREILLPDGKIKSIKGVAGSAFSYPIPHAKKSALKKEINLPEKFEGEVKEGQKLGELVVTLDKEVIATVDIVSPEHVPKAGFVTKFLRRIGFDT